MELRQLFKLKLKEKICCVGFFFFFPYRIFGNLLYLARYMYACIYMHTYLIYVFYIRVCLFLPVVKCILKKRGYGHTHLLQPRDLQGCLGSTRQARVHSDYHPRFPRSSNFYCQQEDFPNFHSPVLSPLSPAGRNLLPPLPLSSPSLPPLSSIRNVTTPSAAPELSCWQGLMGRMKDLKPTSTMCCTDPSKAIASIFHQEKMLCRRD